MNSFVESLKRLYESQKVGIEHINKLLKNGKITEEEYQYIINK